MFQKSHLSLWMLLSTLLLLVACQPLVAPEESAQDTAQAGQHAAVHWTYEGEEGPEHWGELSEEFALCAAGVEQSPIDLTSATEADLSNIAFNYQPSALKIINNGHTVQVNIEPGSTIEVDGATYELKQFHFHTQSEHTQDGAHFPLELHLVHQSAEGQLAVVGVMAEPGAEHAAFAPVWENMPAEAGADVQVEGVTINATDLLPAESLYYAYNGSLTTPPCSEGVKWHVLTTPIQMSQEQIDALHAIIHDNYRPVQPLHERELAVDTTS